MPPERQRLAIELGAGLSRTGAPLAVRPGRARDLRNVYAMVDELRVRRGIDFGTIYTDETGASLSHILAIQPLRLLFVTVVVGYRQTTGKVYVYRANSTGGLPERIPHENGNPYWFALAANTAPPSIIAADTYGKLFLAHDDPYVASREATVYYDHETARIKVLNADLGSGSSSPVKFRGVVRHLDYLLGWGFGHATEDRPELVRASLPGDPLSWDPEDYWIVGQRGDSVLRVAPAGNTAVAFKAHELYQLSGHDRASFAIRPLDQLVGLLGSHLVATVHDTLFFWSRQGPYVTNGASAAVPLGFELDLQGFEPSDLVTLSEDQPFGAYIPTRKAVAFFFGRRVYTLCLEAEQREWTYLELAERAWCASVLYDETVAAPIGYPTLLAVGAGSTAGEYSLTVAFNHTSARGNEWVELWLRLRTVDHSATWQLYKTAIVNPAAAPQTVVLTGLNPATEYQVAARYAAANQYTTGYSGATPNDWSSAAYQEGTVKRFYTTQAATTRVLSSATWQRLNGESIITLVWTGGPTAPATTDIQKSTDGTTFTTIANVEAGTTEYEYTASASETAGTNIAAANAGTARLYFRLQPREGTALGPVSNVLNVWVGPSRPLGMSGPGLSCPESSPCGPYYAAQAGSSGSYKKIYLQWINTVSPSATSQSSSEAYWAQERPGEALSWSATALSSGTLNSLGTYTTPDVDALFDYYAKVRHQLYDPISGIVDLSDFTVVREVAVANRRFTAAALTLAVTAAGVLSP